MTVIPQGGTTDAAALLRNVTDLNEKGPTTMSDGYVELPGSERPRKQGAERVRPLESDERFEVTVMLKGKSLPPLDTSKPAMTRDELESAYGASPENIAKVKGTLERFGLSVGAISRVGRSMRVSGTAAQMQDAFQANLGIYHDEDQGEFRGRESPVQIPVELAGIVSGVFGLDQRRVAHRIGGALAVEPAAEEASAFGPAALEKHYAFPAGGGTGQTVGIAEFGGAYSQEDLEAFCRRNKLEMPQVTAVNAGEKPLTPSEVARLPEPQRKENMDDSGEVMMDIEIVAGLCQGAAIFVYFSSFGEQGWIDLLNQVIGGQPAAPSVLSVSWGLAEESPEWSEAARTEINKLLEAAAHLGITVCAAAGDDGSGDQMRDNHAHVNFPASSPFVLSVGGTKLEGEREVTWWEAPGYRTEQGGGATGGGVSAFFPRPAWQTEEVESLNKGAIKGRIVPDIAALAGFPGYQLVIGGQLQSNGGTSAATPLWASLIARILALGKPTQGQTFIAPLLYESANAGEPARGDVACTDIAEGNNASKPEAGYKAKVGYDAVTGWGVPNGVRLLSSL